MLFLLFGNLVLANLSIVVFGFVFVLFVVLVLFVLFV